MFGWWRINRLKVKLAGEEALVKELYAIVHSGSKINTYYLDELIRAQYVVAGLKQKIIQLS